MSKNNQITIIGCGVNGLSTGIRLLEAGYEVQIVARDLPPNTTSNWAAAIWFPVHVYPYDRVLGWGAATFDVLQSLHDVPAAGVRNTLLTLATPEPPEDAPWWADAVPTYHHATSDELPDGYLYGYSIPVPVCDTALYLDYLVAQYSGLGGTIEQREIEAFEELIRPLRQAQDRPKTVIINCTGLGSYSLANDKTLFPIRGQIVRVRQPEVINSVVSPLEIGDQLAYVIPRTHDIVLGGTMQENNWDETIDPATAERILADTAKLVPALEGAEVLGQGVALRPGRPTVRLEAEHFADDCVVIHNYGHGGAGFTLSWGCADEIVGMVQQFTKSS